MAAVKEISADAAVVPVLSELGGTFTSTEGFFFLVDNMFSTLLLSGFGKSLVIYHSA